MADPPDPHAPTARTDSDGTWQPSLSQIQPGTAASRGWLRVTVLAWGALAGQAIVWSVAAVADPSAWRTTMAAGVGIAAVLTWRKFRWCLRRLARPQPEADRIGGNVDGLLAHTVAAIDDLRACPADPAAVAQLTSALDTASRTSPAADAGAHIAVIAALVSPQPRWPSLRRVAAAAAALCVLAALSSLAGLDTLTMPGLAVRITHAAAAAWTLAELLRVRRAVQGSTADSRRGSALAGWIALWAAVFAAPWLAFLPPWVRIAALVCGLVGGCIVVTSALTHHKRRSPRSIPQQQQRILQDAWLDARGQAALDPPTPHTSPLSRLRALIEVTALIGHRDDISAAVHFELAAALADARAACDRIGAGADADHLIAQALAAAR